MMKIKLKWILLILIGSILHIANATMRIPMYIENGSSLQSIGTVQADDTIYGLLLTPNLHHLPPGIHGFHIHEFPFCHHHATGAGGHLDPMQTKRHRGPYAGDGHLGDLPVLIVNKKGEANLPVLAPRLQLSKIAGRSLMIHAGGDNYSDTPEKLGGGGRRLACGVVPNA